MLCSYTPLVEPISLDEAFLDVSGATMLFGSSARDRGEDRADVEREVGVTCSVGVAPSKFVAKLASDDCKPNGMLVVPVGGVQAFLEPLPVGRLWGVGEKTGETLGRLGIRTIGDLGRTPESILERLLGHASAHHLHELANGIDDRDVIPYEAPKSVSHEETFERDLDADEDILRELLDLSGRVAARLRADGYCTRTVALKARLANFQTLTRIPDALRRYGYRSRSLPHRRRALRRAARPAPTDPAAGGAGRLGWSRPAPSSSRCCTGSAGATSSACSIGSSCGSAGERRDRPP